MGHTTTRKIKLSDKQKRFIDEYYANGFNGKEAARAAGYKATSEKSLRTAACKNLANPNCQKYLQSIKAHAATKFRITKETQAKKLANIQENMERVMLECRNEENPQRLNNMLLREFIKANDTIMNAIQMENKMFGIDEPEKVEHSGQVTQFILKEERTYNDD